MASVSSLTVWAVNNQTWNAFVQLYSQPDWIWDQIRDRMPGLVEDEIGEIRDQISGNLFPVATRQRGFGEITEIPLATPSMLARKK